MSLKVNPFYNIEAPVGPYQPNRPDDVSLVQYLLVKVATKTVGRWKTPESALTVTGTYSPALGEWIMSYQKATKCVNDGVVHPQSNPHWKVALNDVYGTILSLNASFRNNFGAARHDNMVGEPDLPGNLRQALSQTNSRPGMGSMA